MVDRDGDDTRSRQIEANLLEAARKPHTSVAALIASCQDNAVARVRARVCYTIMEAVARRARKRSSPDADTRSLALYAGRALRLLRDATEGEGDGVRIAAAHLGADFDFDMDKYVAWALFGRRFPVWPEWSSNLGEIETETGAPGAQRDLAYRFRINGAIPGDGARTTAFAARLKWWREALDGDTLRPNHLALIVFLAAVVPEAPPPPDAVEADLDGTDAPARARAAAERVCTGGRAAIAALLDELAAKDKALENMGRALVRVLKSPAGDLLDEEASETLSLHVCIRRDVVESSRVYGRPDEILARSPKGDTQKEVFFQNLDVAETPLPGAPFSFRVDVELFGRGVHASGERLEIESQRDISGPCVLALMQPCVASMRPGASAGKTSPAEWAAARMQPSFTMEQWRRAPVLRLLYEPGLLSMGKPSGEEAAQKLLFRQAALAVLAAVCARRLIERAGAARSTRVLVIRGAEPARADLVQAGEDIGYAVSQALELVLGRCWPVRVQGYEQRGDHTQTYRLRGSLDALLGAFPVVQSGPGASPPRDRLALMTVVSRPCDTHPESVAPDEETHLLLGRVYLAERGPAGGVTTRLLRGLAAVHRADEAWERQVSIVEALERLHADGIRDVVLLTHRFMGRQSGRSAPAHRHFETAGFQADMARRHPDLRLYRLVRHVFPALRLKGGHARRDGPDVYEVVGYDEHHDRWMDASSRFAGGAMHGLVPFYSLATLRVVGDDEGRPQSGFVTYSALMDQTALGPAAFATNAALLGDGQEGRRLREGVISCLRALHYLEAERPARHRVGQKRYVQPVLDPYGWSTPARKEDIGEIAVRPAGERRGTGGVVLSLPAMLERVMLVLDLMGDDEAAPAPVPVPPPDGPTAGPAHATPGGAP